MAVHQPRPVFSPGDSLSSYTIVSLIGQGGYGDIYLVSRPDQNANLAMKVESRSTDKQVLAIELRFLESLQDSPLFPRLIESGQTSTHQFVVMELLGPSLSNTRRQLPGRHYTVATVLRLALFMLECLREFHSHGFVHRDVKPGNFLLNPRGPKPLVLIDFGLSKRFIDLQTRQPCPPSTNCGFHGTPKYASLSAQTCHDQSPRDDLISLLYSMAEMIEGRLPWGLDDDSRVIQRKKAVISSRSLFSGFPGEILEVREYLDRLTYFSKVNYNFIACLFGRALKKTGKPIDGPFDWEELPMDAFREISSIDRLPGAMQFVTALPLVVAAADEQIDEYDRCVLCEVA
jgi:serine/threonine protein kinase